MSSDAEALFPPPEADSSAAVLLQLAELADRVQVLEDLLTAEPDVAGYQPVPAPKWWLLDGDERAEAIDRLASWVDAVYRPSYGHLAARLPACWPEHPLCLFVLDWMTELHSLLYLRKRRAASTVAGQAEFTIRQLPAAADLMATETRACRHEHATLNGAIR